MLCCSEPSVAAQEWGDEEGVPDSMEVTIFSRISALKSFSLETSQGKWADTCSTWFGAEKGQFNHGEGS
jgi:hypothetical protein